MIKRPSRVLIASAAIGVGTSVTFLFGSWLTNFDSFLISQFPGFFVSSLFWGMPGFAHYVPKHRCSFLFPYLMVLVNSLCYGVLAYLFIVFTSGNGHNSVGDPQ